MGISDRIKGNPFEKLKKDNLTAERIRLERDEKLKIGAVGKNSARKKELFTKGFQVGEAERRALARQIQQLDQKIKLDNIQLKRSSDKICLVDNLIFIHDNKAVLERKGLIHNLLKMPKSKLDDFLAKVNVKDQISAGNINELLTTMQAEYGLLSEAEDDKDTAEIISIWADGDIVSPDEAFSTWDKEKAAKEKEAELE